MPFEAMTEATMQRAVAYARKQDSAVAEYMASVGVSKPMHIGETGWASIDVKVY